MTTPALSPAWGGNSVLVTGCTGFLGSWMIRELTRCGAAVVGLVRDLTPRSQLRFPEAFDQIALVRGDLEDRPLLERALNEYEVDTVFHLGAQAIVGTANRSPLSTFESNIRGTWNLLEACRSVATVRCVIVASSDKAYGDQIQLPYTEDAPLQGRYPYDASKSCADLLAQCYFHTYKLPVCITRNANFFGGGDFNFNRIIPGTIRSVLRGEAPVIRSDGKFVRDYIYVQDVVGAYLLLAQRMQEPALHGHAFNFSNEVQLTVLEVVDLALELMSAQHLTPVVLNQASGEIRSQYLSCEKARRLLDWRPAYSFQAGLQETIGWYRNYLEAKDAP